MNETLFSPYWYRAAELHPRLVSSASISRQCFRGDQWYVISSQSTGRQFRVNSLGYQVVGRLDGRLSVQEIWDVLIRDLGNDAPSQHEMLSILSDLTAAGMIQSETTPDLGGIFDAAERRRKRNGGGKLNPLAFKVPLFDPTSLLDTLLPLTRWVFNGKVLALWFIAVIAAAVIAAMHWVELRAYGSVHLFGPRNLLLMWICYPIVKIIHEIGHALAIRHWQGEVREIGATLFLFMPVPYVDASAASAFPEKHRRILVSAMGIIAETAIASFALLVWLNIADGWGRDIAFSCLIISGLSTLLVNANPLMRFDGYYVLSDYLEAPALASRSGAYLRYLGERHLLGNKAAIAPPEDAIPRPWLLFYGVAALIYRIVLLTGMVVWLFGKMALAGFSLALYLGIKYAAVPLWQLIQLIFVSPRLEQVRYRAASVFVLATAVLLVPVFVLPVSHTTRTQGVVWLPDEARVRNETEGFVQEVLVRDGEEVQAGQVLLVLDNPELYAERDKVESRIASLEIAYQSTLLRQPAQALAIAEGIEKLYAQRSDLDQRLSKLTLKSPLSGRLALPYSDDLPGRYYGRGGLVAHVVSPNAITVRTVLTQSDIDLLRQAPKHIAIRIAENRERSLVGRMGKEMPAATYDLPSAMLGEKGNGPIMTDPSDQDGLRSLESFFLVDLNVIGEPLARIGGRAWVHIEHQPATLGQQWMRSARQAFIKQFNADETAFLL